MPDHRTIYLFQDRDTDDFALCADKTGFPLPRDKEQSWLLRGYLTDDELAAFEDDALEQLYRTGVCLIRTDPETLPN